MSYLVWSICQNVEVIGAVFSGLWLAGLDISAVPVKLFEETARLLIL